MIALFYFVVAVPASPFKPKSRLEAENAVLRHQLIVLRRKVRGEGSRIPTAGSSSTLSLVSVDPEGRDDCPTRNAGALASGRLSPLLTLEIASTGRATADRDRIVRADPADEHGEFSLGCAAHPWRTAQARV
jgi:hypothetical protein